MNNGSSVVFFFVKPDAHRTQEDFRAALKNINTRRIFRLLLSVSNAMSPSYGDDNRSTEYNEGLRAMGLWLLANIEKTAPGEVAALMRESSEEYAAHFAAQQKENR